RGPTVLLTSRRLLSNLIIGAFSESTHREVARKVYAATAAESSKPDGTMSKGTARDPPALLMLCAPRSMRKDQGSLMTALARLILRQRSAVILVAVILLVAGGITATRMH